MQVLEMDISAHSSRLNLRRENFSEYFKASTLLVRGGAEVLESTDGPCVAVIGTRRPTEYGRDFVKRLMLHLSVQCPTITIVSGGAMGIDTEAHVQALLHGLKTHAWVVGPIAQPNPRSHARLFDRIAATSGSAVFCVDQLEPRLLGRACMPFDWVRRNAWIAGSVDAIVVVEAMLDSGTQTTVDFAGKMGVPVYLLPGPVFSPQSRGTNHMISIGSGRVIEDIETLTKSLLVDLG